MQEEAQRPVHDPGPQVFMDSGLTLKACPGMTA
jgi:hypothetical protein